MADDQEDWEAEIAEEQTSSTGGGHLPVDPSVSGEKISALTKSLGRGQWFDEDRGVDIGQATHSVGRGIRHHTSVIVGANKNDSYSPSNGHDQKWTVDDYGGWNESPSDKQTTNHFNDNDGRFKSSDKFYDNNGRSDSRGRRGRFENRGSGNTRYNRETNEESRGNFDRGYGSSDRGGSRRRFDNHDSGNSRYNREPRKEGGEHGEFDYEKSDRVSSDSWRSQRGAGRSRGRGGSFGGDDDVPLGGGFRRGGPNERGGRGMGRPNDTRKDVNGKPNIPPPYVPPSPPEDEFGCESIPSGINFDKYKDIHCKVSGLDPPQPIDSFEDSGLREILKERVKASGYVVPTPVQKHAIPIIMADRDLMACAQTGSGKTAAYLLPVLHRLMEDGIESASLKQCQEPYVVILCPTRELACQIDRESRKFSFNTIVRCKLLYGGTSVRHQLDQLNSGCHILVATPGRLLDVLNKEKVSFANVRFLILDEADKMLDMGFMPDIQKISLHPSLPPKEKRKTLMFSATFPEDIQHLAREFLDNYLFVAVGLIGGANADVKQQFINVPAFEKRKQLLTILRQGEKAMVFLQLKRNADFLASYLSQNGFMATSIHGDRFQAQREEALRDFKTGKMSVLVATAVAARGLDIKDVGHVINYDLPSTIEEYVHRIGRTGRVGNIGCSTSFYDPQVDKPLARSLVKVLSDALQEVPDWLKEEADMAIGTNVYSTGGKYGASDIRSYKEYRRNNSADDHWDRPAGRQNSNEQPKLTEEECWD